MMADVLAAPGLQKTITRLAALGEEEQVLRKRAEKYYFKIASDYNERWLVLWDKVLSWLWQTIYKGFVLDQQGLASIREISQRMPCVLIPCHRSHADYLILSYVLYKQRLPLPHVAAGDNMNFWPLGYIFRQSGAFFLRRSFQGDELYTEVFSTYLGNLLRGAAPIEFFLEGGRSRTGKMVRPKYGMIAMIMRAYRNKVSDDLALIPVYIGYERVIEDNSYIKELSGISKKRESLLDVISNSKIMLRNYGSVYLNIGVPIFLKSYCAKQQSQSTSGTEVEPQLLYRDIASLVVAEINRISVVTPVSLVAAALLCHGGEATTGAMLVEITGAFYDWLRYRKAMLAPALASKNRAVSGAVTHWIRRGCLMGKECGEEEMGPADIYLLPDDKRLLLEYYKNNLIHHFLPLSFLAAVVLACPEKGISMNKVGENYIFLKHVLRLEFLMSNDHAGEIEDALIYLDQVGILKKAVLQDTGEWGEGVRERLRPFAGLVGSCLLSYGTVFKACLALSEKLPSWKSPLAAVRQWADGMYTRGEIGRRESLSGEAYKNALKFLEEEGIIASVTADGEGVGTGRSAVLYESRLEILVRQLSRFL
ncbi:MAG: 1-acyl-sn-glycerol-3-phosphate acyltransferase [Syntrophales bacterium LBB04]|nr:1-acyl-sn-glycerol-3-phosphate acyltransferase [Syntrophales bacterium LBB04]